MDPEGPVSLAHARPWPCTGCRIDAWDGDGLPASGWPSPRGINAGYACEGDGCLDEDARAAVEEAGLRVAEVEPGCEKDYLIATLALLAGYADIGVRLAAGDLDGANERTLELDADDNRMMRAFVECLDELSGGGAEPTPVSSGNA